MANASWWMIAIPNWLLVSLPYNAIPVSLLVSGYITKELKNKAVLNSKQYVTRHEKMGLMCT